MIATFHVDLDNATEVTQLKELLEQRLIQIQKKGSDIDPKTVEEVNGDLDRVTTTENETNTTDNLSILSHFVSQASPNQIKVLKWMKDHPGPISAHILKQELLFLAPHGALSGVFRAGRWVKLSGGTKEGFPFFQIEWNHEKGCGIYRGLTQEEADYIQFKVTDKNESLIEGEE